MVNIHYNNLKPWTLYNTMDPPEYVISVTSRPVEKYKQIMAVESSNKARELRVAYGTLLIADFNLSGGCFGTDIVQNYTKCSNIEAHGLIFWPIFAKFQCAFCLLRKMKKHDHMAKKTQKCSFSWKNILRSYMPHTKVRKTKCSDIINWNLINLLSTMKCD